MIKSMTGYARCERTVDWGTLTWEIRSVNHRYLDPGFRLPEDFRVLEHKLRVVLSECIGRGKVDCNLRLQRNQAVAARIELNTPLLESLETAARQVAARLDDADEINPVDLLRWPGVVREPEPDTEPMHQMALELFQQALDELGAAREREGARIHDMIAQRCEEISQRVADVRISIPEILDRLRNRIAERVGQLNIEINPERLEQEIAILAQKMDVAEELDRLDAHIEEVLSVMDRKEPVGRRLDFLMQELNREANTLSSKSQNTSTTRHAVDIKVFIEQLREQIQNIE
jgi:uncharacterized protein (TIGR00255 family)